MIQPATKVARDAILDWIADHPSASIEDVADSGLYVSRRAKNIDNAALCWARHHVVALRCAGAVQVAGGSGDRGDPLRYCVTSLRAASGER